MFTTIALFVMSKWLPASNQTNGQSSKLALESNGLINSLTLWKLLINSKNDSTVYGISETPGFAGNKLNTQFIQGWLITVVQLINLLFKI